jgi:DnaK suppressor protein
MYCLLPEGYKPHDDEPFMNVRQREYFRRRLVSWREELLTHSAGTLDHLRRDSAHEADISDQASLEEEFSAELRFRERERKLLIKIEEALERLEDGTYGYCEETGEAISLARLESRLVATLSVEAQEERENRQKFSKGVSPQIGF